jgi:trk system potassium uptake protein TrkH
VETLTDLAIFLFNFAFRRSAARTAVASFLCVVLAGTVLLTLPFSSRAGQWTHPVDALFTATSAACVTGLIVKSTPDYWSLAGQLVILALIQIGGLGMMAIGAFVAVMLPRRYRARLGTVVTDLAEASPIESIWMLLRFILLFTLCAEVLGTAALYLAWGGEFPAFWPRVYYSAFHAVSAFCNAGFSLNNQNLVPYVNSVGVNVSICLLIVVGGLGFMVVRDLADYGRWWLLGRKGKLPRLATHTKLVLTVTGVLLLIGFLGFFVIESYGSLAQAPLETKLLASMFQSVTPRTAGFNTVDLSRTAAVPVARASVFLIIALMYIGGSPGGTAGGIKTSTLGIMIASIVAILRGRARAELFRHTVPEETVHRVVSIVLLSIVALAVSIFVLLITETAQFELVVFDAVSAFGTVGLSIGLTGPGAAITAAGKLILTALMFFGRLGPVTFVLGVAYLKDTAAYEYPEEHILVG